MTGAPEGHGDAILTGGSERYENRAFRWANAPEKILDMGKGMSDNYAIGETEAGNDGGVAGKG